MHRLLVLVLILVAGILGFQLGFRNQSDVSDENDVDVTVDSTFSGASQAARVRQDAVRRQYLRRIAESDTYLPAMIEESDSMVRRWSERRKDPLRVHIEPSDVRGVSQQKVRAVQDAFRRWERVPEIPIDFVYSRDPDRSDVTVRWIEAFAMERAGQAEVLWQADGLLRRGTLTLATHTQNGVPFSTDAIFTVALHEIGHLLGLGHSDEPKDVMYPTTGVHDLTRRDRQTAMLLYNLPPGHLGR